MPVVWACADLAGGVDTVFVGTVTEFGAGYKADGMAASGLQSRWKQAVQKRAICDLLTLQMIKELQVISPERLCRINRYD